MGKGGPFTESLNNLLNENVNQDALEAHEKIIDVILKVGVLGASVSFGATIGYTFLDLMLF